MQIITQWKFAKIVVKNLSILGRGGYQVISVLTFYSDDPSSNPAVIYSFYYVNCLKKDENKQKEAGNGPFLKKLFL